MAERSVWTKKDFQRLKQQADDYLLNTSPYKGFIRLRYLTRDKDPEYFTEIMDEEDGLMEKYVKDLYGSPECPLSGRMDGLFFRAVVNNKTKRPFPNSPYGSRRLQIPAGDLITPDKHLYLADFYCMFRGNSKTNVTKHHVTLVLCHPGSDADVICRDSLPRLDIRNNNYLVIRADGVFVTKGRRDGCYVEIFYTENMDISPYSDCFSDVHRFTKRRTKNPRKNTDCPYCNLK